MNENQQALLRAVKEDLDYAVLNLEDLLSSLDSVSIYDRDKVRFRLVLAHLKAAEDVLYDDN